MSTWASGQFIIGQQGQNGATVSAWLTSRFGGGTPIAANTSLPSGTPDAGPVTTGTGYGGAGFYALELPSADDYAIAIQWDGSIYYFLVTAGGGGGGGLPSWFQYGEGTPVGTVVPAQKGAVYQDTTNGAFYEAVGVTDADWVAVGGNGDATVPGVTVTPDGQVLVLTNLNQVSGFSDVAAAAGSGNGLFWNVGAADGDQTVSWQTGAPAEPNSGGIDTAGNLTAAGWLKLESVGSLHMTDEDPNTAEPGTEGDVCWRNDTRGWYGCSTTGDPGTWTPLGDLSAWGQVATAKYTYAGDPNGHVTPDAKGDVCLDTATPAVYQATGTSDTDWEIVGGGSGGLPDVGTSQFNSNALAAVKYLAIDAATYWPGSGGADTSLPSFTYAEPTLTATSDGVLSVDGSAVSVADRVLVIGGAASDGVYAVTAVGSVSAPFVLTRAGDADSSADLGQNLVIRVSEGTDWASAVAQWIPYVYGSGYVLGTAVPSISLAFNSVDGPSFAEGDTTAALADGAHSEGYLSAATSNSAHAEGDGTLATAPGSHSEGTSTIASGNSSHAEGIQSRAYLGDGAHAESWGQIATPGDSQFQRFGGGVTTTDATLTPVLSVEFPDWVHTANVTIRVVARRTDVPGTDSAWEIKGVVRGDGTSTYSWVGGTDPTPVVIAQDVAAATWAIDTPIDGEGFDVKVTGEIANTVNWSATAELGEVAG